MEEWWDRLIDSRYRAVFRQWVEKEWPAHLQRVDAFTMARYPVRNDEYRAFISETGSRMPESLAFNLPGDHPVWGVRLDEAEAYLRWRGMLDGCPWRLPTEAEWEWAASGPNGFRYPYGDLFDPRRCNTIESGRRTTCSVDAIPSGASPWGVESMAGNVEEWTSSRYQPYPGGTFIADDLSQLIGCDYPILRGGSFLLGGDLTRCRRRHGPHPELRFRIAGFRAVASGAISEDKTARGNL